MKSNLRSREIDVKSLPMVYVFVYCERDLSYKCYAGLYNYLEFKDLLLGITKLLKYTSVKLSLVRR